VTVEPADHSLLRDLTAILIAACACPAALFGTSMVGCMGQGFNAQCALSAAYISPVILIAAGIAAGLLTSGLIGLFLMWVGVAIGMTALLILSYMADRPVPLDPISGFIATIWFLTPVVIGYGTGRLIARLLSTRDPRGGGPG
jgi:hypothetical protein